MAVVGDDAGLAAGEADGVAAQVADGHAKEGHGDAFTGGEKHIEFAPFGVGGNLLGQFEEMIRGVAHGGDDHDDVLARGPGLEHSPGDLADFLGIGDAATAVFLNDDGHEDGSDGLGDAA